MGLRIWLLGFIFGLCETGYFGWNLLPQGSPKVRRLRDTIRWPQGCLHGMFAVGRRYRRSFGYI